MNSINYFKHTSFSPETYHRRYDFDISQKPPKCEEGTFRRIAIAALPLIGLYRPLGCAISIGMNGLRTFSAISSLKSSDHFAQNAAKTALAVASFAAAVFGFTICLFATTAADLGQSSYEAARHLLNGEYAALFEELLQMASSGFYLGFMCSGALEAMLIFTILQAGVSLYQARNEFANGRWIEGASKTILGCVRLRQANHYHHLIERRNIMIRLQKYQQLFARAQQGRQVRHLIDSPLAKMQTEIEKRRVICPEASNAECNLAAHFHGFGKVLVKGENLTFRTKIVDGKEVLELDFKVNHAFREQIEDTFKYLMSLDPKDTKEILSLTGSHATGISAKDIPFKVGSKEFHPGHELTVEGLGTILIGASSKIPNLYDRIVIQMDKTKTIYDLHELIAFMDLDDALRLSTHDDLDRLKIGHLFRTFFPQTATQLERTEEFFTLPLDELKAKILSVCPDMNEIFDLYFGRMSPGEILPGKVRYRINGLADTAYALGARAFTAAITGAYENEELFPRIASILKIGLLATEVRDENELNIKGLSSYSDYFSGGADSVFTQMITEKDCRENRSWDSFYYHGKVRILISLNALETGTYQYHFDSFGTRHTGSHFWSSPYLSRPGILEFIREEQNAKVHYPGHEVMFKERIAPSFFKGLIVRDMKTKDELLAYLWKSGLIKADALGRECILGIEKDLFVRVGQEITEELIS